MTKELDEIKGIGPKYIKLLAKLGITTTNDLITYFPYKYNIYKFSSLSDKNDTLIISAIIETNPSIAYIKKNFNKLSFRANVHNQIINVVIFNRAFLKVNLQVGKNITLIGKYDISKNQFIASDIKFNIVNGQIEPIYHLTNGITQNFLHKIISSITIDKNLKDNIPQKYVQKYNFLSKNDAALKMHNPKNIKEIKEAKIRLIYEELFEFSFKMNYLNKSNKTVKGVVKSYDEAEVQNLINNLPFKLTIDQQNVIREILSDLRSEKRMNRLLLGDVGSGKTIVSAIAIYCAFLSGFQSTLMAPTEILALQHYGTIKNFLKNTNINLDIITGSMTLSEKKKIYKKLLNNEIDLLIGTHSILNDNLKFANLGLVITDEQHRFGVNQRNILQKKSEAPDILYLSATPIPRTYAMTIYGDLDISMIKVKPNGRKQIITKVISEKNIKNVLLAILNEVKDNHQVYIVSPLVDQNDMIDLKSVKLLKEKIDLAYQNKIRSEIIHGKMKQVDKDKIMDDFKNNKIKILISTTVIEVGIDNPNATMMIIFNAERFGLATLHQLRGRVGRGDYQSYCYLISEKKSERLSVMEESNDGFYIAEKDFEIRGQGDFFGTKQSGDMNFKLANLKENYDILVQAKNDVSEFIDSGDYQNNEYYKNLINQIDIAK